MTKAIARAEGLESLRGNEERMREGKVKKRSVWVVEIWNKPGWLSASGDCGWKERKDAWREARRRRAVPALKGIKYRVVRYDASK